MSPAPTCASLQEQMLVHFFFLAKRLLFPVNGIHIQQDSRYSRQESVSQFQHVRATYSFKLIRYSPDHGVLKRSSSATLGRLTETLWIPRFTHSLSSHSSSRKVSKLFKTIFFFTNATCCYNAEFHGRCPQKIMHILTRKGGVKLDRSRPPNSVTAQKAK